MSPVQNPEAQARENIDRLLIAVGWHVFDMADANIHAAKGVAIREFAEPRIALIGLLPPQGRNQFERATSSISGLHTLSAEKVARLTIPLPPFAEQRRIVEEVERLLSLICGVEIQTGANLKHAGSMKQSVLATVFFSGY